jgi:hypothetical protein
VVGSCVVSVGDKGEVTFAKGSGTSKACNCHCSINLIRWLSQSANSYNVHLAAGLLLLLLLGCLLVPGAQPPCLPACVCQSGNHFPSPELPPPLLEGWQDNIAAIPMHQRHLQLTLGLRQCQRKRNRRWVRAGLSVAPPPPSKRRVVLCPLHLCSRQ